MSFNKKERVLISFIIVAVLVRLFPHPPNVAPITAVALFAGTHFSRKHWAILMPILAMLVTDVFLGFSMITPIVYLAFVGVTALGFVLKKMNIGTVLLSSLLFFVVTNLGVWFLYYPLTPEGLMTCFTLALPFFGYAVVGDLFFSAALLFGYRYAAKRFQLA
jgi:hypothetical protein|tara:strand:- start:130 stop:615 length:486 start_codon:yes stop_codon:yes gene_type:complete